MKILPTRKLQSWSTAILCQVATHLEVGMLTFYLHFTVFSMSPKDQEIHKVNLGEIPAQSNYPRETNPAVAEMEVKIDASMVMRYRVSPV